MHNGKHKYISKTELCVRGKKKNLRKEKRSFAMREHDAHYKMNVCYCRCLYVREKERSERRIPGL